MVSSTLDENHHEQARHASQAGESTTLNLDANPRPQLGRGVHNFGHKSPYANISSQLGWGVHHVAH